MTATELKYLIVLDKLYDGIHGVRLVDVARVAGVSKVSVHKAVEKLERAGLIAHDIQNRVYVTADGCAKVNEARGAVAYLADLLEHYCWIDGDTAYAEAMNAVCAVSESTRKTVAKALAAMENKKQ